MRLAKYIRLSSADEDIEAGGKAESDSVANQRALLERYIESRSDLRGAETLEFVDDGRSGTNFERPGFQALMELARRGGIDCVLVKDDCVNIELNSEGLENTGFCEVSSVF